LRIGSLPNRPFSSPKHCPLLTAPSCYVNLSVPPHLIAEPKYHQTPPSPSLPWAISKKCCDLLWVVNMVFLFFSAVWCHPRLFLTVLPGKTGFFPRDDLWSFASAFFLSFHFLCSVPHKGFLEFRCQHATLTLHISRTVHFYTCPPLPVPRSPACLLFLFTTFCFLCFPTVGKRCSPSPPPLT